MFDFMKKSSILGVEQSLRLFHFSFGIPDENNSLCPLGAVPFVLVFAKYEARRK